MNYDKILKVYTTNAAILSTDFLAYMNITGPPD